MITITIELPDKFKEFIQQEGYKVNSYIDTYFINPLIEKYLRKKK